MTAEVWVSVCMGVTGVIGGLIAWAVMMATTRLMIMTHLRDCETYRKNQEKFNERIEKGQARTLAIVTLLAVRAGVKVDGLTDDFER